MNTNTSAPIRSFHLAASIATGRARHRVSCIVSALASISLALCLVACSEKKRNANRDMQQNQTTLMDQMDKIAAEEEAKQAEAKKKAEEAAASKPTPTGTDQPKPAEPAKSEPPATPKPADKPPT